MKAGRSLAVLDARLRRRIVRLELLVGMSTRLDNFEKRRLASYVTIEMTNCWALYVRCLYLSIMTGAKSRRGSAISVGTGLVASEQEALVKATSLFNPRVNPRKIKPRDEPDWFHPSILTRLASTFGFSNFSEIARAFSYQTRAFEYGPTFRNYYAHKSTLTAKKVEKIRVKTYPGSNKDPAFLLLEPYSARDAIALREWLHDLRVISSILTE